MKTYFHSILLNNKLNINPYFYLFISSDIYSFHQIFIDYFVTVTKSSQSLKKQKTAFYMQRVGLLPPFISAISNLITQHTFFWGLFFSTWWKIERFNLYSKLREPFPSFMVWGLERDQARAKRSQPLSHTQRRELRETLVSIHFVPPSQLSHC